MSSILSLRGNKRLKRPTDRWTDEGIKRYNSHFDMIRKMRAGTCTGEKLEDHIKEHWMGTLKERKGNKRKHKDVVEACEEDAEFDGKYAEI